ncbi:MarR family winged helix-turn-helix transcriptional regulator [Fructilactobacillus sp. Tb1]|uniref:MarR family winged helix-turn-helix transcriptional regulator n=1 Tax=Fructilactobacillus sp. Tb1 TaxID=3422304 RepID=UPI003D275D80
MNEATIKMIRQFNRAYTQQLGLLKKHVFDSDISWAEARILLELSNLSTPTLIQISVNLELDKSYVSRVLKKLEKLGYLTKQDSETDKRAKILQLTKLGLEVVKKLNVASDQQIKTMMKHLNPNEQNELVMAIETINHLILRGNDTNFEAESLKM